MAGGGFVVTWTSYNQDGSSYGVYAQRYNADGSAAGTEFRINESTAGGQYQSSVTALANGGFVVSWYNDNYDVSASGTTAEVRGSLDKEIIRRIIRFRPAISTGRLARGITASMNAG